MPQSPTLPQITNREKAILTLLIQGKSNRAIATELYLALPTVKEYCSRLYAKFKVSHRTELVIRILEKTPPEIHTLVGLSNRGRGISMGQKMFANSE